ncbi:MAG: hypothetical protein AAF311_10940 [Pseudomonadota bacterium]
MDFHEGAEASLEGRKGIERLAGARASGPAGAGASREGDHRHFTVLKGSLPERGRFGGCPRGHVGDIGGFDVPDIGGGWQAVLGKPQTTIPQIVADGFMEVGIKSVFLEE